MILLTLKEKEYILESDRKLSSEEQTVFFLRPLSALEYAEIQDNLIFDDGVKNKKQPKVKNWNQNSIIMLQYGLTGWKNAKDSSGKVVEFDKGDWQKNINVLPISARFELSNVIFEMTFLTESDKKK